MFTPFYPSVMRRGSDWIQKAASVGCRNPAETKTDGALEKWVFPCLKLGLALGLMLAGIQHASRVDKWALVINNCHRRSRMFSYTFDPVLHFNLSPEHSSLILFSAL